MSGQKPLDLLGRSIDKNVLVKLKGGRGLRGKLVGFDQHMNLILNEAVEIAEEEGEEIKNLGTVIVRGDNVIIISPPPT
ncbi:MAG: LSM domain-containing protein [Candidatus Odinarchaeia archaeon]